jgi:hypothetical protein
MSRWMTLAVLCLALPAAAQSPQGPPPGRGGHGPMHDLTPEDQKAIHDFKLTTSVTDRLVDAGKKVRDLAEKDPSLEKANPMAGAKGLDESVKRIEQYPEVVSIMKGEGVTPREFVLGAFTLMTATMWSSLRKSYPQAEVPAYVNPDNMKFIDDHPEVLQKFRAAFEKGGHRMRPHGAPGEGGADAGPDGK